MLNRLGEPPANSDLHRVLLARSSRLTMEAYFFLVLIIICLAFGGVVVYQAPRITTSDINQGLDQRSVSVNSDLQRLQNRNAEIGPIFEHELKGCDGAYSELFKSLPPNTAAAPEDHAFHSPPSYGDYFPDGSEIAAAISKLLSSLEVDGLVNVAHLIHRIAGIR